MFDDFNQEFIRDLKLLAKKIGVVDSKCEELGDITDHFHDSTDKLETLYARDIEKRKKLFHGSLIQLEDNTIIDLAEVDAIFDSIEIEEHRSTIAIFFYWYNLLLLGVIGLSGYIWT